MNPIQEFFDSRARDWDTSCPHDHRKIETLLSLVPPPEGGKVLDAACAIINDMATFDEAGIDDGYLDEIREGDKFTVEGAQ